MEAVADAVVVIEHPATPSDMSWAMTNLALLLPSVRRRSEKCERAGTMCMAMGAHVTAREVTGLCKQSHLG